MNDGPANPPGEYQPTADLNIVARIIGLAVIVTSGALFAYSLVVPSGSVGASIQLGYVLVAGSVALVLIELHRARIGVGILVLSIQVLLLVEPYLITHEISHLAVYLLVSGLTVMVLFSLSGLFLPRPVVIVIIAVTMVNFIVVLVLSRIDVFRHATPYVAGAIFIGGVLVVYLQKVSDMHQRRAIIEARNARAAERRVRSMLEEKTTLLREIHHRVKNNLQIVSSLLSLQAQSIEDPNVRSALRAVRGRVAAMALVHDTLKTTESTSAVDLLPFVQALFRSVREVHADRSEVSIQLDIDDIRIDISKLVSLGLILNEFTENSYEHAFPDTRRGCISISIRETTDNSLVVRFQDDGIGLPDGILEKDRDSLGLTLVQQMARQLAGSLTLGSVDATSGVHWSLEFAPR
jgi:two-component sensor histidine kinase